MGSRKTHEVAPDVVRVPDHIVNTYLVGTKGAPSGKWVLVDAGLADAAKRIKLAAARRFGPSSRPRAIILTHGHFDHIGSVERLAEYWDVPVYAHKLEMPYITGQAAYPPPDPSVGGGLMARLAPLYPNEPIDLGQRAHALPTNHRVPGVSDWRWVPTPGHTHGHISLFRDRDRVLIAGDAFVTVKQESALAVLTQHKKVHRPPAYFTSDWVEAWKSVRRLTELRPEVAATGHGVPMRGEKLRSQLDALERHFARDAVPKQGRYIRLPALADENGVRFVPEKRSSTAAKLAGGLGLAALLGLSKLALDRRG
ncbi:MBL fold metallo-hydrolase [Persicimonas caeni]|uniref:MBL fold metallo-hydrolase n=1 Tax=Persicimonas caeni TaxID=2292766 RepID=A0A4Y6PXZ8_PERCE|nr:MBL fold metallo-hydrolase [Persicimonas caeni]QDG53019.1 MBL fold metallo-hydrolase [Persicimonas caeni]QED34241.1 MBL fold metallo-hydrolase [Persicimonas caeni]